MFASTRLKLTAVPILRERPRDTVPDLPAGDSLADGDHFARAVRERDEWKRLLRVIPAVHHHPVAVVQGGGMDAD
jgi:hypothetical protein